MNATSTTLSEPTIRVANQVVNTTTPVATRVLTVSSQPKVSTMAPPDQKIPPARQYVAPLTEGTRQMFTVIDKLHLGSAMSRVLSFASGRMRVDHRWFDEDWEDQTLFFNGQLEDNQVADLRLVPSTNPSVSFWSKGMKKGMKQEIAEASWRRENLAVALQREDQFPPTPRDCGCFTTPLPPDPWLCDMCQRWRDAVHLVWCRGVPLYRQNDGLTVDFAGLRSRPNCIYCRYLRTRLEAVFDVEGQDSDRSFLIDGPFWIHFRGWTIDEEHVHLRCIVRLRPTTTNICFQTKLTYGKNTARLVNITSWEETCADLALVKQWVQECSETHDAVCTDTAAPLSDEVREDFRLVDTEKMNIILARTETGYAALSYVWGEAVTATLQLMRANAADLAIEGSLTGRELPQTISDALAVCRALGIRYLWVDQLCIVQDATLALKLRQINHMDEIYSNARLTIVALAAISARSGIVGSPGRPRPECVTSPREYLSQLHEMRASLPAELSNSRWNSRGWTFQERIMSRRCLYFGQNQASFQCRSMLAEEQNGRFPGASRHIRYPHSIQNLFNNQKRRGVEANIRLGEFTRYCEYVELYTLRSLTIASDILNAFAGISSALSRRMGSPIIAGLPEVFFHSALIWYNRRVGPESQEVDPSKFPSWSWASSLQGKYYWCNSIVVSGAYVESSTSLDRQIQHGLCHLYVMTQDSGLVSIKTDYIFKPEDLDLPLDKPLRKVLKHRPDELDPGATALATQYPQSLVFNGSVAQVALGDEHESREDSVFAPPISFPKSAAEGLPRLLVSNKLDAQKLTKRVGNEPLTELDRSDHMSQYCCGNSVAVELVAMTVSHTPVRREMDEELPWHGMTRSSYRINVLILRRDSDGSARRIGVGQVSIVNWMKLNPQWKTIILV